MAALRAQKPETPPADWYAVYRPPKPAMSEIDLAMMLLWPLVSAGTTFAFYWLLS
jgi:hypothetical protein